MSDGSSKPSFDASKIELLPWYVAVRRRAKMYVSEVSAKGLSSAIAKTAFYGLNPDMMNQATETLITTNTDSSYSFQDNGRGVPIIDSRNRNRDSMLEALFAGPGVTRELYQSTGFLVNWGTILNALSEKFSVETTLKSVHSSITFSRGEVVIPLNEVNNSSKTGTFIFFKPDKEIWEETQLEPQMLLDSLNEAFKEFPQALISLEQPQNANERFRILVKLN